MKMAKQLGWSMLAHQLYLYAYGFEHGMKGEIRLEPRVSHFPIVHSKEGEHQRRKVVHLGKTIEAHQGCQAFYELEPGMDHELMGQNRLV